MANDWTDRTGAMVVAILLAELHYQDEMERNDTLNVVIAGYISYRRILSTSGQAELDDFISKACRQISPANFEYVLCLLEEALSKPSPIASDFVHLATVLLGNHPQSRSLSMHLLQPAHPFDLTDTLRIMQAFFTRCLDIFTNDDAFTTGTIGLRLHTLDYLVEHASERVRRTRCVVIMSDLTRLLLACCSAVVGHGKHVVPPLEVPLSFGSTRRVYIAPNLPQNCRSRQRYHPSPARPGDTDATAYGDGPTPAHSLYAAMQTTACV